MRFTLAQPILHFWTPLPLVTCGTSSHPFPYRGERIFREQGSSMAIRRAGHRRERWYDKVGRRDKKRWQKTDGRAHYWTVHPWRPSGSMMHLRWLLNWNSVSYLSTSCFPYCGTALANTIRRVSGISVHQASPRKRHDQEILHYPLRDYSAKLSIL